jgi:rod shape-determining protein MreC
MESFFVRFKNSLVLTVVLLAQIILLAVQVRNPDGPTQEDGRKVLLIRSWVVAVVIPVERASNAIGQGIRGGWSNYIDLRSARQQNQQLRQEIARLRLEQAEFSEDAAQGRRLQELLAFREHYVTSTVAAQVIGTSGVDQSRVLYIDKGSADGLKPDMAVITPDGIVGKVRDVFPGTSPHTAQVLEINDPTSGAGIILASTRIRAILRGALGGGIQIGNLTQDSRIKPGEAVLTSGGDQIFPRGLKVGTIESIEPDPDHQPYTRIRVKPAANLTQLEEVLVITGTQADLPPQAQQDLAAGEDAAAQAKRAAQLAAERLPSLNPTPDGSTPATPANPAVPAVATVPRPIPTLHPDRYTPGATPPAADLTPGTRNPAPEGTNNPPPPPDASGSQSQPQPDTQTETKPAPKKAPRSTPPPAQDANPPQPNSQQPKEPQL